MKTWTNQEEKLVVGNSFCINSNSNYKKKGGRGGGIPNTSLGWNNIFILLRKKRKNWCSMEIDASTSSIGMA
jgi:hypothetical protein